MYQTITRIRGHQLPKCSASGKRRYRDFRQAQDGLISTRRARQFDEFCGRESNRHEARIYQCPTCLGWHCTSQKIAVVKVSA